MNWVCAGILSTVVLLAQGAPRKAEPAAAPAGGPVDEIASAREDLRQATARLGEDHPVTAFMLRNLALAMEQAGYANYAERYAQQSLAILERRFGPTDISLVPALNVLAEASVMLSKYDEARKYAMRAVAMGPEAGAHYGTALHNLAAVFHAEGRYQEAADYYRQALAVREKLLPPGHPYTQLTREALKQVQHSVKLTARR